MYGRYVLFSLPGCASRLVAQDPFEIHIYEYEPMWLGQYSLEAQLNADFMFLNAWEAGLLAANCRLACPAASVCARVMATPRPVRLCGGVLVSEHSL